MVSLGNEELEYEIRSGQSFGTQCALQSVYTNSLFFEGHQFPSTARGTDWFPDFPRLLSCHDSTDHPLPTNFSLGRFSKHRALILLRTRLSSGEFWEFEEII